MAASRTRDPTAVRNARCRDERALDRGGSQALSGVARTVILDLSDATLTDDTAVSSLDQFRRDLVERGRRLALINVYDHIRERINDQQAAQRLDH